MSYIFLCAFVRVGVDVGAQALACACACVALLIQHATPRSTIFFDIIS